MGVGSRFEGELAADAELEIAAPVELKELIAARPQLRAEKVEHGDAGRDEDRVAGQQAQREFGRRPPVKPPDL